MMDKTNNSKEKDDDFDVNGICREDSMTKHSFFYDERRFSSTNVLNTGSLNSASGVSNTATTTYNFKNPGLFYQWKRQRNAMREIKSNETKKEEKMNLHDLHLFGITGEKVAGLHFMHGYGYLNLRYVRKFRSICGGLVNNAYVQQFIILLIFLNAIFMGVSTYKISPDVLDIMEIADKAFLIVFTIESAMQLIYHGSALFNDGWLVFDLSIVISSWSMDSLQVFRSLRILRAIRLIGRLQSLRSLVIAVITTIPDMTGAWCLFLLLTYIYSVMCTVLFQDAVEAEIIPVDYPIFDRIDYSFFTLFQFFTLDNWIAIVRPLWYEYPYCGFIFGTYIAISAFLLMSLMAAILCTAVAEVDHVEDMEEEQIHMRQRIDHLILKVNRMKVQQNRQILFVQTAIHKFKSNNNMNNNSKNKKYNNNINTSSSSSSAGASKDVMTTAKFNKTTTRTTKNENNAITTIDIENKRQRLRLLQDNIALQN